MNKAISSEDLREFALSFASDSVNRLAMNAVTSVGLNNAARSFDAGRLDHTYSLSLKQHGITWQKSSGRCWMYSGYNFLRDRVIEKLGLEDFVFSGSYLMFYDKLEKANFFLEQIIKYRDEPSDSRHIMGLMRGVRSDGGEWEMFVSLVQKYGVVPREVQPETVSTDDSRGMAPVVAEKLREYGRDLRRACKEGKSVDELRAMKDEMMSTVYRMYCICYGEPVKKFDFKVRGKDGKFICDRGITPREFYDKYVGVDLDQYVNLTAGASNGKELKKFVYPDVGDVIEGKKSAYVSVSVETLKETALRQLTDGEPVVFACDVGERSWRAGGVLDDKLYDYDDLLGIKLDMGRENRFAYSQAHMSHAMCLKGADLDDNNKPLFWRVENSWGPDAGKKGMFIMTDGWFDQYTYQVIINRKYVPEEILKVYDGEEAAELEKWQINI